MAASRARQAFRDDESDEELQQAAQPEPQVQARKPDSSGDDAASRKPYAQRQGLSAISARFRHPSLQRPDDPGDLRPTTPPTGTSARTRQPDWASTVLQMLQNSAMAAQTANVNEASQQGSVSAAAAKARKLAASVGSAPIPRVSAPAPPAPSTKVAAARTLDNSSSDDEYAGQETGAALTSTIAVDLKPQAAVIAATRSTRSSRMSNTATSGSHSTVSDVPNPSTSSSRFSGRVPNVGSLAATVAAAFEGLPGHRIQATAHAIAQRQQNQQLPRSARHQRNPSNVSVASEASQPDSLASSRQTLGSSRLSATVQRAVARQRLMDSSSGEDEADGPGQDGQLQASDAVPNAATLTAIFARVRPLSPLAPPTQIPGLPSAPAAVPSAATSSRKSPAAAVAVIAPSKGKAASVGHRHRAVSSSGGGQREQQPQLKHQSSGGYGIVGVESGAFSFHAAMQGLAGRGSGAMSPSMRQAAAAASAEVAAAAASSMQPLPLTSINPAPMQSPPMRHTNAPSMAPPATTHGTAASGEDSTVFNGADGTAALRQAAAAAAASTSAMATHTQVSKSQRIASWLEQQPSLSTVGVHDDVISEYGGTIASSEPGTKAVQPGRKGGCRAGLAPAKEQDLSGETNDRGRGVIASDGARSARMWPVRLTVSSDDDDDGEDLADEQQTAAKAAAAAGSIGKNAKASAPSELASGAVGARAPGRAGRLAAAPLPATAVAAAAQRLGGAEVSAPVVPAASLRPAAEAAPSFSSPSFCVPGSRSPVDSSSSSPGPAKAQGHAAPSTDMMEDPSAAVSAAAGLVEQPHDRLSKIGGSLEHPRASSGPVAFGGLSSSAYPHGSPRVPSGSHLTSNELRLMLSALARPGWPATVAPKEPGVAHGASAPSDLAVQQSLGADSVQSFSYLEMLNAMRSMSSAGGTFAGMFLPPPSMGSGSVISSSSGTSRAGKGHSCRAADGTRRGSTSARELPSSPAAAQQKQKLVPQSARDISAGRGFHLFPYDTAASVGGGSSLVDEHPLAAPMQRDWSTTASTVSGPCTAMDEVQLQTQRDFAEMVRLWTRLTGRQLGSTEALENLDGLRHDGASGYPVTPCADGKPGSSMTADSNSSSPPKLQPQPHPSAAVLAASAAAMATSAVIAAASGVHSHSHHAFHPGMPHHNPATNVATTQTPAPDKPQEPLCKSRCSESPVTRAVLAPGPAAKWSPANPKSQTQASALHLLSQPGVSAVPRDDGSDAGSLAKPSSARRAASAVVECMGINDKEQQQQSSGSGPAVASSAADLASTHGELVRLMRLVSAAGHAEVLPTDLSDGAKMDFARLVRLLSMAGAAAQESPVPGAVVATAAADAVPTPAIPTPDHSLGGAQLESAHQQTRKVTAGSGTSSAESDAVAATREPGTAADLAEVGVGAVGIPSSRRSSGDTVETGAALNRLYTVLRCMRARDEANRSGDSGLLDVLPCTSAGMQSDGSGAAKTSTASAQLAASPKKAATAATAAAAAAPVAAALDGGRGARSTAVGAGAKEAGGRIHVTRALKLPSGELVELEALVHLLSDDTALEEATAGMDQEAASSWVLELKALVAAHIDQSTPSRVTIAQDLTANTITSQQVRSTQDGCSPAVRARREPVEQPALGSLQASSLSESEILTSALAHPLPSPPASAPNTSRSVWYAMIDDGVQTDLTAHDLASVLQPREQLPPPSASDRDSSLAAESANEPGTSITAAPAVNPSSSPIAIPVAPGVAGGSFPIRNLPIASEGGLMDAPHQEAVSAGRVGSAGGMLAFLEAADPTTATALLELVQALQLMTLHSRRRRWVSDGSSVVSGTYYLDPRPGGEPGTLAGGLSTTGSCITDLRYSFGTSIGPSVSQAGLAHAEAGEGMSLAAQATVRAATTGGAAVAAAERAGQALAPPPQRRTHNAGLPPRPAPVHSPTDPDTDPTAMHLRRALRAVSGGGTARQQPTPMPQHAVGTAAAATIQTPSLHEPQQPRSGAVDASPVLLAARTSAEAHIARALEILTLGSRVLQSPNDAVAAADAAAEAELRVQEELVAALLALLTSGPPAGPPGSICSPVNVLATAAMSPQSPTAATRQQPQSPATCGAGKSADVIAPAAVCAQEDIVQRVDLALLPSAQQPGQASGASPVTVDVAAPGPIDETGSKESGSKDVIAARSLNLSPVPSVAAAAASPPAGEAVTPTNAGRELSMTSSALHARIQKVLEEAERVSVNINSLHIRQSPASRDNAEVLDGVPFEQAISFIMEGLRDFEGGPRSLARHLHLMYAPSLGGAASSLMTGGNSSTSASTTMTPNEDLLISRRETAVALGAAAALEAAAIGAAPHDALDRVDRAAAASLGFEGTAVVAADVESQPLREADWERMQSLISAALAAAEAAVSGGLRQCATPGAFDDGDGVEQPLGADHRSSPPPLLHGLEAQETLAVMRQQVVAPSAEELPVPSRALALASSRSNSPARSTSVRLSITGSGVVAGPLTNRSNRSSSGGSSNLRYMGGRPEDTASVLRPKSSILEGLDVLSTGPTSVTLAATASPDPTDPVSSLHLGGHTLNVSLDSGGSDGVEQPGLKSSPMKLSSREDGAVLALSGDVGSAYQYEAPLWHCTGVQRSAPVTSGGVSALGIAVQQTAVPQPQMQTFGGALDLPADRAVELVVAQNCVPYLPSGHLDERLMPVAGDAAAMAAAPQVSVPATEAEQGASSENASPVAAAAFSRPRLPTFATPSAPAVRNSLAARPAAATAGGGDDIDGGGCAKSPSRYANTFGGAGLGCGDMEPASHALAVAHRRNEEEQRRQLDAAALPVASRHGPSSVPEDGRDELHRQGEASAEDEGVRQQQEQPSDVSAVAAVVRSTPVMCAGAASPGQHHMAHTAGDLPRTRPPASDGEPQVPTVTALDRFKAPTAAPAAPPNHNPQAVRPASTSSPFIVIQPVEMQAPPAPVFAWSPRAASNDGSLFPSVRLARDVMTGCSASRTTGTPSYNTSDAAAVHVDTEGAAAVVGAVGATKPRGRSGNEESARRALFTTADAEPAPAAAAPGDPAGASSSPQEQLLTQAAQLLLQAMQRAAEGQPEQEAAFRILSPLLHNLAQASTGATAVQQPQHAPSMTAVAAVMPISAQTALLAAGAGDGADMVLVPGNADGSLLQSAVVLSRPDYPALPPQLRLGAAGELAEPPAIALGAASRGSFSFGNTGVVPPVLTPSAAVPALPGPQGNLATAADLEAFKEDVMSSVRSALMEIVDMIGSTVVQSATVTAAASSDDDTGGSGSGAIGLDEDDDVCGNEGSKAGGLLDTAHGPGRLQPAGSAADQQEIRITRSELEAFMFGRAVLGSTAAATDLLGARLRDVYSQPPKQPAGQRRQEHQQEHPHHQSTSAWSLKTEVSGEFERNNSNDSPGAGHGSIPGSVKSEAGAGVPRDSPLRRPLSDGTDFKALFRMSMEHLRGHLQGGQPQHSSASWRSSSGGGHSSSSSRSPSPTLGQSDVTTRPPTLAAASHPPPRSAGQHHHPEPSVDSAHRALQHTADQQQQQQPQLGPADVFEASLGPAVPWSMAQQLLDAATEAVSASSRLDARTREADVVDLDAQLSGVLRSELTDPVLLRPDPASPGVLAADHATAASPSSPVAAPAASLDAAPRVRDSDVDLVSMSGNATGGLERPSRVPGFAGPTSLGGVGWDVGEEEELAGGADASPRAQSEVDLPRLHSHNLSHLHPHQHSQVEPQPHLSRSISSTPTTRASSASAAGTTVPAPQPHIVATGTPSRLRMTSPPGSGALAEEDRPLSSFQLVVSGGPSSSDSPLRRRTHSPGPLRRQAPVRVDAVATASPAVVVTRSVDSASPTVNSLEELESFLRVFKSRIGQEEQAVAISTAAASPARLALTAAVVMPLLQQQQPPLAASGAVPMILAPGTASVEVTAPCGPYSARSTNDCGSVFYDDTGLLGYDPDAHMADLTLGRSDSVRTGFNMFTIRASAASAMAAAAAVEQAFSPRQDPCDLEPAGVRPTVAVRTRCGLVAEGAAVAAALAEQQQQKLTQQQMQLAQSEPGTGREPESSGGPPSESVSAASRGSSYATPTNPLLREHLEHFQALLEKANDLVDRLMLADEECSEGGADASITPPGRNAQLLSAGGSARKRLSYRLSQQHHRASAAAAAATAGGGTPNKSAAGPSGNVSSATPKRRESSSRRNTLSPAASPADGSAPTSASTPIATSTPAPTAAPTAMTKGSAETPPPLMRTSLDPELAALFPATAARLARPHAHIEQSPDAANTLVSSAVTAVPQLAAGANRARSLSFNSPVGSPAENSLAMAGVEAVTGLVGATPRSVVCDDTSVTTTPMASGQVDSGVVAAAAAPLATPLALVAALLAEAHSRMEFRSLEEQRGADRVLSAVLDEHFAHVLGTPRGFLTPARMAPRPAAAAGVGAGDPEAVPPASDVAETARRQLVEQLAALASQPIASAAAAATAAQCTAAGGLAGPPSSDMGSAFSPAVEIASAADVIAVKGRAAVESPPSQILAQQQQQPAVSAAADAIRASADQAQQPLSQQDQHPHQLNSDPSLPTPPPPPPEQEQQAQDRAAAPSPDAPPPPSPPRSPAGVQLHLLTAPRSPPRAQAQPQPQAGPEADAAPDAQLSSGFQPPFQEHDELKDFLSLMMRQRFDLLSSALDQVQRVSGGSAPGALQQRHEQQQQPPILEPTSSEGSSAISSTVPSGNSLAAQLALIDQMASSMTPAMLAELFAAQQPLPQLPTRASFSAGGGGSMAVVTGIPLVPPSLCVPMTSTAVLHPQPLMPYQEFDSDSSRTSLNLSLTGSARHYDSPAWSSGQTPRGLSNGPAAAVATALIARRLAASVVLRNSAGGCTVPSSGGATSHGGASVVHALPSSVMASEGGVIEAVQAVETMRAAEAEAGQAAMLYDLSHLIDDDESALSGGPSGAFQSPRSLTSTTLTTPGTATLHRSSRTQVSPTTDGGSHLRGYPAALRYNPVYDPNAPTSTGGASTTFGRSPRAALAASESVNSDGGASVCAAAGGLTTLHHETAYTPLAQAACDGGSSARLAAALHSRLRSAGGTSTAVLVPNPAFEDFPSGSSNTTAMGHEDLPPSVSAVADAEALRAAAAAVVAAAAAAAAVGGLEPAPVAHPDGSVDHAEGAAALPGLATGLDGSSQPPAVAAAGQAPPVLQLLPSDSIGIHAMSSFSAATATASDALLHAMGSSGAFIGTPTALPLSPVVDLPTAIMSPAAEFPSPANMPVTPAMETTASTPAELLPASPDEPEEPEDGESSTDLVSLLKSSLTESQLNLLSVAPELPSASRRNSNVSSQSGHPVAPGQQHLQVPVGQQQQPSAGGASNASSVPSMASSMRLGGPGADTTVSIDFDEISREAAEVVDTLSIAPSVGTQPSVMTQPSVATQPSASSQPSIHVQPVVSPANQLGPGSGVVQDALQATVMGSALPLRSQQPREQVRMAAPDAALLVAGTAASGASTARTKGGMVAAAVRLFESGELGPLEDVSPGQGCSGDGATQGAVPVYETPMSPKPVFKPASRVCSGIPRAPPSPGGSLQGGRSPVASAWGSRRNSESSLPDELLLLKRVPGDLLLGDQPQRQQQMQPEGAAVSKVTPEAEAAAAHTAEAPIEEERAMGEGAVPVMEVAEAEDESSFFFSGTPSLSTGVSTERSLPLNYTGSVSTTAGSASRAGGSSSRRASIAPFAAAASPLMATSSQGMGSLTELDLADEAASVAAEEATAPMAADGEETEEATVLTREWVPTTSQEVATPLTQPWGSLSEAAASAKAPSTPLVSARSEPVPALVDQLAVAALCDSRSGSNPGARVGRSASPVQTRRTGGGCNGSGSGNGGNILGAGQASPSAKLRFPSSGSPALVGSMSIVASVSTGGGGRPASPMTGAQVRAQSGAAALALARANRQSSPAQLRRTTHGSVSSPRMGGASGGGMARTTSSPARSVGGGGGFSATFGTANRRASQSPSRIATARAGKTGGQGGRVGGNSGVGGMAGGGASSALVEQQAAQHEQAIPQVDRGSGSEGVGEAEFAEATRAQPPLHEAVRAYRNSRRSLV